MKRGTILSALLHLTVALLLIFGVPSVFDFRWWEREEEKEQAIVVQDESALPPELQPAKEALPSGKKEATEKERLATDTEPDKETERTETPEKAEKPEKTEKTEKAETNAPTAEQTQPPAEEQPSETLPIEEPRQDSVAPESVETASERELSEETPNGPVPPDEQETWQPATMVTERQDLVPLPELNNPERLEPSPVPLADRETAPAAPAQPKIEAEGEDEASGAAFEPSKAEQAKAEKPEAGALIGREGEGRPSADAAPMASGAQGATGAASARAPGAPGQGAQPPTPEAALAPQGIATEGEGTSPRQGSPEAPRENTQGAVSVELVPKEGAAETELALANEAAGAKPGAEAPAPDRASESSQALSYEQVQEALEQPIDSLESLGQLIDAMLGDVLAPVRSAGSKAKEFADALEKEAEAGHVEEQFLLGELYREGTGVQQSAPLAAKWQGKAAEKRYVAAQIRFGYQNAAGEGVPRDLVSAYMWFTLAAGDLLARRARDFVAQTMTREQVLEAEKRALQMKQVWSNWERFARLNAPEIDGDLIAAARDGDVEKVKRLLDEGADVNALDDKGRSALLWAAINKKTDVSLALLARGADPNAQDERGKSALMWAADNGDQATVEALLKKDIDVNARDDFNETALINAAWSGRARIVEILLTKGASIDLRDNYGATALVWSGINGHLPVAELLLEGGADLEAKDHDGLTALMRAAWNDHPEVVELLLRHGADPRAKDAQGRTALDLATQENNEDVLRLLRAAGPSG